MDKRVKQIWRRILYGMGDIYGAGSFLLLNSLYLRFLIDVQFLPPALAGLVPMIAKIWDSALDPFMGTLADNTKSRFGRRRVYFLIGIVTSFLSFALMWTSFGIDSTIGKFLYFVFVYIGFSTAVTIVEIPYNSVLPEMVENYQMRTNFITFRTAFSIISSVIAGIAPGIILTSLPVDEATAYLIMGTGFAVLFGLSWLGVYFGTWEKPESEVVRTNESPLVYFMNMRTVFKNKTYLKYLGIYVAGVSSSDFLIALFLYYLNVVVNRADQYSFFLGILIGMQLISVPIYYVLSKRFGKVAPVKFGLPMWIIGLTVALFLTPSTSIYLLIFVVMVIGLGAASVTYTSSLILPDMSDVDELMTGQRREGVYAAMTIFVRKLVGALIVGIIGFYLSFINYDASLVVQSDATRLGIRIFFSFFPLILMLATFGFATMFKMNKETYEIVMKEIHYRRAHQGKTRATSETRLVCERITGVPFDQLWSTPDQPLPPPKTKKPEKNAENN